MQAANRLQKALKKGGATFGAWQMLPGTNHSRAIARSGVDWICVDGEHGNIDDGQMHEAVAAIAACGVSPIVRIAANEGWMVKRALDAGAHGVVVPLMYTADDARQLVKTAKFPPLGVRGFGSPYAPPVFDVTSTEYLQQANDSLVTIVQIETKEALQNVDEIAKVPGVDVLLIGPFDLGNNIGHPILDGTMHQELKDAIMHIHEAAEKNGKRTGIYCTTGEQSREYADKGFNMISIAADMIAIPTYFAQTLATAKGSLAHSAVQFAKGGIAKMTGPYGR
ncbi:2,4-dihydroxyhept-2-ene-1,7-dioic acid aldolase [Coniosporium apollinis CBS 100218]|uniref:2,4-dihydroxyhept-2-ene-1,7-dioic acid aldolase n=1 Tax=Coniosporium apollinis (strain CBS 100218) TaxID=1168221 RepID=R7Z045_CONA1|nr:2,4-dihydroxyhept-2-ene-1,7-dioic acid aldolase [Coniosporium apollinis CBS 100218]EON67458.1 2,4-dihydroxyhept-2-ene-1,7-dioic acid aldolase [Coniosporium apollinis CBS 100218]